MSLDNIQLPNIVLQQLYGKNLVELTVKSSGKKATPTSSINMLGKNKKQIIILIESAGNAYLPEAELNFLIGILSACQLSMEDVGIVNIQRHEALKYQQFGSEIAAEKILLFGVSPASLQLPLSFPFYQLQTFHGVTYLSSPALAALMQDKEEKMKLWMSLKQLFSI